MMTKSLMTSLMMLHLHQLHHQCQLEHLHRPLRHRQLLERHLHPLHHQQIVSLSNRKANVNLVRFYLQHIFLTILYNFVFSTISTKTISGFYFNFKLAILLSCNRKSLQSLQRANSTVQRVCSLHCIFSKRMESLFQTL